MITRRAGVALFELDVSADVTMTALVLATLAVLCWSQVSDGHEVGGLTFEVPDNDRFCFYEDFLNASVYILHYTVSQQISKTAFLTFLFSS